MENKKKKAYNLILIILLFLPLFYNPAVIDINLFHKVITNCITVMFVFFLVIRSDFIFNKYYFFTVIIFIIFTYLSSVINDNSVLFFESGFDISTYYIIVLFTIYSIKDLKINVKNIITFIVIASAIFSAIGILQLAGINFFNLKEAIKPGSTLGLRNFAAEYLLASIPFAIFLILELKKNVYTILSTLGLLIILTYTFLLRSRISYVIIMIYIILLIIFYFFQRKNVSFDYTKHKYVLLIIILIASFTFSFLPLSQIESERKNVTDASGSYFKYRYEPNFGRITFYDASIRLFLEKPVFGIGTNAFPGYYGKYQWDELGDRVVYNISFTHPHNEFLKILSENGIFSFIIFCVIVFYPYLRLFKKTKLNNKALPFFLCYTGALTNMLVAFPLSNVSLIIPLAISAGYALIPYDNKEVSQKIVSGKIFIIFLIIISVFSLYVNFIRYKSEIKYSNAMHMKFENKYKDMISILENTDKNLYPLDPSKMPLDYYLGVGYFEEGLYEKALECFNQANRLMPYLLAIISNKSTTLYAMGNVYEAEKTLLDLKSKFSHYYEPQINLLALYMNSKRYDDAKILSKQIEADSTSKFAKNHNLFLLMKKELDLSH